MPIERRPDVSVNPDFKEKHMAQTEKLTTKSDDIKGYSVLAFAFLALLGGGYLIDIGTTALFNFVVRYQATCVVIETPSP